MKTLIGLLITLAVVPPSAGAQVIEYYHLDAVGNVRAVTDQQGRIIERHDYLPFGEECLAGPCAANPGVGAGQPRKFTGKERDQETGFDYFGARYYGSKIGRFTTVDAVYTWRENLFDPQRWNRYAYARNNPLRYVDPDGRELRVAGDVNLAVAALQSTVPAADRGFITAVDQNGQMVIDARAINEGRASESENFLSIRELPLDPADGQ